MGENESKWKGERKGEEERRESEGKEKIKKEK